jgi:hypothetical protein
MRRFILGAIFALVFSLPASAVTTEFLQDDLAKDFEAGTTENIVISNFGQISLGLESVPLLQERQDVSAVFAVGTLPDGSVVAATGPEGLVLKHKDGKWEQLFKADQPYVFSMVIGKTGKVYVGATGTEGHIYEISPDGKSKLIFRDPDAQYIWALALLEGGKLIAATGPNGKVHLIDQSGSKCIFSCEQKNIISMAVGREGNIYLGTDTEAVLYVLEPKDNEYTSRALYDVDEDQISAIAVGNDGLVYFGTASGKAAPAGPRGFLEKPVGQPVPQTQPTQSSQEAAVPSPDVKQLSAKQPPSAKRSPKPETGKAGGGNAVYQLDQLGFVSEVFRDQLDMCSMIWHRGKLVVGTWPEGWMLEVDPGTEEIRTTAKAKAKFVYSISINDQGQILYAAGSPGVVAVLGPKLAQSGTFTSKVHDAGQIARWGVLSAEAINAGKPGVSTSIQTRTGAVEKETDPAWSAWSSAEPLAKARLITSPAARFIQYRMTFASDGREAETIDKVKIAYMQDNQAPEIESVQVQAGAEPPQGPPGRPEAEPKNKNLKVVWKAVDANSDTLEYQIFLRLSGTPYWIELEKAYEQTMYQWDPDSVPDGEYQFKIVASDKPDNPVDMALTAARLSDPFIVDNTPPEVRELVVEVTGTGSLVLKANLVDKQSEIAAAWVKINAEKDWQYIAPADEIYDGSKEYVETVLPRPSSGPVLISVKVKDEAGNLGYGRIIVPPAKPDPSAVAQR